MELMERVRSFKRNLDENDDPSVPWYRNKKRILLLLICLVVSKLFNSNILLESTPFTCIGIICPRSDVNVCQSHECCRKVIKIFREKMLKLHFPNKLYVYHINL